MVVQYEKRQKTGLNWTIFFIAAHADQRLAGIEKNQSKKSTGALSVHPR
jgi:hypothetical protein